MCGIVGCILKNKGKAAPILLDSISKLEYRGYDSIGIATFNNNHINIKKDQGNIGEVNIKLALADMDVDSIKLILSRMDLANIRLVLSNLDEMNVKLVLAILNESNVETVFDNWNDIKPKLTENIGLNTKIPLEDMDGDYGIAHVRWATHGIPSKINAHPHTDENEKIAVVHNGIIENYLEIKEQLINEGHVFKSETDTEVIPILIGKYMDKGLDLESAVRETINIIKGAYAIAAICKDEHKIVATRKDSPLIVGLGEKGYFVASDSPAILDYAKDFIYPEQDEIVILTPNEVVVKDKFENPIEKTVETITWTADMAQKEGYDYFMIKEIHEQPTAIKNTFTGQKDIKTIVDDVKEDINRIVFVACGTSFHASLTGKYLIESLAGIPTEVILASEFKYSANTLNDKTLVIFISQSGETADTLKAIDIANKTSKTLAMVNVVGSSATRKADYVIYTQAGPEIGVAATKTYLSQLVAIYIFSAFISGHEELLDEIQKVPEFMDEILEDTSSIEEMAKKYEEKKDFFFIGRGYSYPIALEGALKLKEITYIHGEGYAAGELKHGPLALIDEGVPVVVILPPGELYKKTMSNLEEVKSRGAMVLAVGASDDEVLSDAADDLMGINPEINDILAPLIYVVPLQLLSYYVAIEKGLDPDKPKNLAKCVTVE